MQIRLYVFVFASLFLCACYAESAVPYVVTTQTWVVVSGLESRPTPTTEVRTDTATLRVPTFEDSAPPPQDPEPAPSARTSPCVEYQDHGCYWMENYSGHGCWIPAHRVGVVGRQACFAANSCGEGLGRSGGGCYKWAACDTCAPEPW